MKKIFLMLFVAVFATSCVNTQRNLGSMIKKADEHLTSTPTVIKKAGENLISTPTVEEAKSENSIDANVIMSNGVSIVNPFREFIDVEFVGAYGDSSTGNVTFIFKARNKTDETRANFGGGNRSAAFDRQGKSYAPHLGADSKMINTPKNIWVEIRLDGFAAFQKVPDTVAMFNLVKVNIHIGANRGDIEFRDIPILWNVPMPQ